MRVRRVGALERTNFQRPQRNLHEGYVMAPILAFNLGPQEIIILLLLGVLLFGRRLPEVGRYLGKGLVEFKKGFKGLEDDIMDHSSAHASTPSPTAIEPPRPPQRVG